MVSPAQDCSKWVPGSPPWESEALLKCIVIAGIFLLFLILIQRNAFSILLLNVSSFAGCVYLNNLYHVKDIPFYPLFPRIFPPLISNKFFFLSCIFWDGHIWFIWKLLMWSIWLTNVKPTLPLNITWSWWRMFLICYCNQLIFLTRILQSIYWIGL